MATHWCSKLRCWMKPEYCSQRKASKLGGSTCASCLDACGLTDKDKRELISKQTEGKIVSPVFKMSTDVVEITCPSCGQIRKGFRWYAEKCEKNGVVCSSCNKGRMQSPHLCTVCGERDPEMFSEGRKSTCIVCRRKINKDYMSRKRKEGS